tara:strand:- start:2303 stop:2515 length:213 start_codon:yes stop_codon:yes gene_type:complete
LREWLIARLRVGLPIEQTDAAQLSEIADDYFGALDVKHSTLKNLSISGITATFATKHLVLLAQQGYLVKI